MTRCLTSVRDLGNRGSPLCWRRDPRPPSRRTQLAARVAWGGRRVRPRALRSRGVRAPGAARGGAHAVSSDERRRRSKRRNACRGVGAQRPSSQGARAGHRPDRAGSDRPRVRGGRRRLRLELRLLRRPEVRRSRLHREPGRRHVLQRHRVWQGHVVRAAKVHTLRRPRERRGAVRGSVRLLRDVALHQQGLPVVQGLGLGLPHLLGLLRGSGLHERHVQGVQQHRREVQVHQRLLRARQPMSGRHLPQVPGEPGPL